MAVLAAQPSSQVLDFLIWWEEKHILSLLNKGHQNLQATVTSNAGGESTLKTLLYLFLGSSEKLQKNYKNE